MNKIETNYTRQIIKLHEQVQANLDKTLNDAIRIGELLNLKKQELGHGNFGNWIKRSLPFTDRTARNYIKIYSNKNELKMESVSDLSSAYKLLKKPSVRTIVDSLNIDYNELWKEITHQCLKECKSREEAELFFDKIDETLRNCQNEIGEYIVRLKMELSRRGYI